MKYNMKDRISRGIMLTDEFSDVDYYQIACECNSKDHNIMVEIEYNKEEDMVSMYFYKDLYWCPYWAHSFIMDIWYRIKACFRMLFTGYIELEETFLFHEDQMDDVIFALTASKIKMMKLKGKNRTNYTPPIRAYPGTRDEQRMWLEEDKKSGNIDPVLQKIIENE